MRRKKPAWSAAVISEPPQTGCGTKARMPARPASALSAGRPTSAWTASAARLSEKRIIGVEQRALAGPQRAAADVGAAQVGDEQHRLDDAGAAVLHALADAPRPRPRAHGEGDLAAAAVGERPGVADLGMPARGSPAAAGAAATERSRSRAAARRRTVRQASLWARVDDADFLHTLTPAEAEALEDMGEPGSYAAGEVIFEEGGTADCVLLVRAGRVRVTAATGDGEELRARRARDGRAARASSSGIDGQPRSASVTALEDVHGLVVPLRSFRSFLMDHPRVALALLEMLSRRLRESEAARRAG